MKRKTITIHLSDISSAAITLGEHTITIHVPIDVPHSIEELNVTMFDDSPVVTPKRQAPKPQAWVEIEE